LSVLQLTNVVRSKNRLDNIFYILSMMRRIVMVIGGLVLITLTAIFGSALLQHAFIQCDHNSKPAYLESTSPRSVPFFQTTWL
jgi:hypothetical protein